MAETHAGQRRRGGIKAILLAALMAFLALNVWTGSPLLALWIGSRVQGEESQPSMGAFAAVIFCLIAFSWGLYQLLKLTANAYQEATGTQPTVRTHAPWLRSMRDERPEPCSRSGSSSSRAPRSAAVAAADLVKNRCRAYALGPTRPGSSVDRAAAF
jgi:hypothetical protein